MDYIIEFFSMYGEYILLTIHALLFVVCFIVELVKARKLNKTITKLCDKCNMPVYEGEDHECFELFKSLSKDEVTLILGFVNYLRGNRNGD